MPVRPEKVIEQAKQRIARIRESLAEMDLLCSGTLLQRTKVCGKLSCRCASDPAARHGPYYEWSHMLKGKLVHRVISAPQADVLRLGIANQRGAKKLMQQWEAETERIMDAQAERDS
jgi:hypothetical protein